MTDFKTSLREFIIPKFKFALTSGAATLVDNLLYILFVMVFSIHHVPANIISGFCGMVINFFLQKKFIFLLNRKISTTFIMSLVFSIVGIGLATLLIDLFNHNSFFEEHPYITKPFVTGIIFFYNFYTKRYVFENRFSW